MMSNYLESAEKQFQYYKQLGDKTFDQLSDEALFWRQSDHQNSIAIIVNHLWGNMMSRWTDFLHTDGEKEWRERDLEFEDVITSREDLLLKWEEGWSCVFKAIDTSKQVEPDTLVYIRNIGHTIVEAINRQLCHYAYHVGQIVIIGKALKDTEWISLSIPKGESSEYNAKRFAQNKHRGHFTEYENE
ncbi:MAG: DUF1572 family protein [Saprospiraceae bacterium]|nr:DUF1572 family protein [Saprospiraceae bacterium]